MFAKIAFALCAISLAYAEYTTEQKEELSLQLIEIKRSVDFHIKIAKIELETQVYSVEATEMNAANDDAAKKCIKGVVVNAVDNRAEVMDDTVGKAAPELQDMYDSVIMKDSKNDSDWDKVKAFLDSFNVNEYRKESRKEFMSKLRSWLDVKQADMQACLKQ